MYGSCLFVLILAVVSAQADLTSEQLANCRADIVFVLDGSGSVKLDNWRLMLNFVTAFAERLDAGTNNFGVVSFGNHATANVRLEDFTDSAGFRHAVQAIAYKDENTNTAAGLRMMRSLFGGAGDREHMPNIAIILTDGVATRETTQTLPEAALARQGGIELFGIGIGSQLDIRELKNIIANDGRVFSVDDFNQLLANLELILGQACTAITVEPTPPPTPTTLPPTDHCYKRDLVIVVDTSGSVGVHNLKHTKTFVKRLLETIPLGPDDTQVAILSYSTETMVHVKLGEYTDLYQIYELIDKIPFKNQRTNISGALRTVRTEILVAGYDRPDAENMVVILTDGACNTESETLKHEAHLLKNSGAHVFTAGIGEKADTYTMSVVSSEPNWYYNIFIDDFAILADQSGTYYVRDHICSELHEPPFDQFQQCSSDIVFAIQQTTNVHDFTMQKEAIKQTVLKLGNCLYAVMLIGTEALGAKTLISFDSYETTTGFLFKLDQIPFVPESGPLEDPLLMIPLIFSHRPAESVGGRPSSRHAPADLRINSHMPIVQDFGSMVIFVLHEVNAIDKDFLDYQMGLFRESYPFIGRMAIGVGAQIDLDVLRIISNKPSSMFVMKTASYDSLLSVHEDIAIAIAAHIAVVDYHCNFEKINEEGALVPDLCDLEQTTEDKFDWLINQGETPSKNTGPKMAVNGTYYAYIEASGHNKGDSAILLSRIPYPDNIGTNQVCGSVFYHMHGWHSGQLQVFFRDIAGHDHVLWNAYGPHGDDWHFAMVQFPSFAGIRFGFKAIRADAYSGDIAIDAITAHHGPCPMAMQFPVKYGYGGM